MASEATLKQVLERLGKALALLEDAVDMRLEHEGEAENRASVALTERFIEVMESEHRELGIGDPTLGRTVRKLVSMLAKRTEQWRSAGEGDWAEATRESLYKEDVGGDALEHSAESLKHFAQRLEATPLERLEQGRIT